MRTRFAPSPTGFLHVGGLRTALYCYLMAKKTGGQFLLRIEDTDQEREVEGALQDIVESLHWMGIAPDEGVTFDTQGKITQVGNKGPYIQSERLSLYKQYADQLLAEGKAYYAFDTVEALEEMREQQKRNGNPAPKYDAGVRMTMKNSLTLTEAEVRERLERGDDYVIRLFVDPNRTIECSDHVRGNLSFKSYTIDDQILLKSDGFPTYHLANIVDDHLMEIDLVIRGEEWLPSYPKHILIYEALGWKPPEFAHLSLLLNPDGSKLSKRQGDVAAHDYAHKGYLPEAMMNFLALLGWNPGTEQDLFTKEEFIAQFDIDRVQKAGAVFDTKKLDWLQGQWVRKMSAEQFASHIRSAVLPVYPAAANDAAFVAKAQLIQDRLLFTHEAPEMMQYFYAEPQVSQDLLLNEKQKVSAEILPQVRSVLLDVLTSVTEADWHTEHLKNILFAAADAHSLTKGQLLWPMRAALTGLPFSPGAFEVAAALGKECTMARLTQWL
jgi:glutamyl-tRNA synthetase